MGAGGSSGGDGREREVTSPRPPRFHGSSATGRPKAVREQNQPFAHGPDTCNVTKHVHAAGNTSWRNPGRISGKVPSRRPEIASRIGPELAVDPPEMPGITWAAVPGPLSGRIT